MREETISTTASREQIEGLRHMTVGQLKEKGHEVFGEDGRFKHNQFLLRRIAWRIQANAWGGLSDRARHRYTPERSVAAKSIPSLAFKNCLISAGLSSFGFPIVVVIDHRMRTSETVANLRLKQFHKKMFKIMLYWKQPRPSRSFCIGKDYEYLILRVP